MEEAQKHNYCVYMHKFPNEKVYIGITGVKPKQRWKRGKSYQNNVYFSRAVKKYGWDNIEHIILENELDKETAEQKEKDLIAQWKSNDIEHGYNITSGGECIGKHSDRTKRQISEKAKERYKNPEYRKRISEAHKGISPSNKGTHMTEEQKRKISLAKQGCDGHGKKSVICIETGAIYESVTQAASMTSARASKIVETCKHHRLTSGGYHWKYADE